MTNQENQTKTNYILRLDHEFPFEQFGKKWIMYLPGYEGMYAISEDCCLCSLDRTIINVNGRHVKCRAKLLKSAISGLKDKTKSNVLGCCFYIVSKSDVNSFFSKKQLMKFSKNKNNIFTGEFPFRFLDKLWIGYLNDPRGKQLDHYLISDDCFILALNTSFKSDLKPNYKIRSWMVQYKSERILVSLEQKGTSPTISINRSLVLNQVSKILEGMNDD